MEDFNYIDENISKVRLVDDEADQGGESWEEQRVGKFTASRLGDLMTRGRDKDKFWGDHAMNYIYEKIAELITGIPHYVKETAAMAWGTDLEAEAIEAYAKKTGFEVHHMGKTFIQFNELCGGSPDGFVGEDGVTEIKCPYNSAIHIKTFITKKVDKSHIYQCQGNMLFTNRKWCDYVSYDPRMPEEMQLVIIRVERDDEICNAILERINAAADEIKRIQELTGIKF